MAIPFLPNLPFIALAVEYDEVLVRVSIQAEEVLTRKKFILIKMYSIKEINISTGLGCSRLSISLLFNHHNVEN